MIFFTYFTLKFFYKFKHEKLPPYLNNMFKQNSAVHIHNTRQAYELHIPRVISTLGGKCIRNYLPKMLSETSPAVKSKIDTHSYFGFSYYLKQHMIEQYNVECTIPLCYICTNDYSGP